jgi:hypothetical protein
MKQLVLDEKTAKKLYPNADKGFKAILHDSFGEKFFQEKITERIKSFENACVEVGEDPEDAKFTQGTPDEIAYKKIKVIVRALNEGWVPDWNNSNQRKWAPWFYLDNPGFRFRGADYAYAHTFTTGGSRLCLHSEELAIYAGKQFTDIYNQYLN